MKSASSRPVAGPGASTEYRAGRLRWALLVIPLVLGQASGAGAANFVHDLGSNGDENPSTTITINPLAEAVPVGDTVIVSIAMDPSATTVTCSDSKSNSYSQNQVDKTNGSGTSGVRTVICSAHIASGKNLATTDTITVTFGASITAKAVEAAHANGLVVAALDKTASATGSITSVSSGSTATTAQPNELLIGAIGYEGKAGEFSAVGSGYTLTSAAVQSSGNSGGSALHISIAPEFQIVAATGTYAATATLTVTDNWAADIATYKYLCGNGVVDAGEQCDGGACCTTACTFASSSTTCRAAANECDLAETCTGSSATCPSDTVKVAGTACTADANQCTDDVCNGTSGAPGCTHPNKTNGTACNDGNACTQTDTCQSGTCTGSNPVVCTASDQCHDVGVCDTGTGVCSNPAKTNGSACNDGNACTQTDTCQSGTCTGSNPVICTASDQCHDVGVCNTGTGVCSNPAKTNGTACNDGNACTQTDTCQSGTCTGSNPVVCTALDQCHEVGTCNTSTGVCSNPNKTNGTACNDSNACTQTDTCQSGTCTGSNPVVCTALDQCHDVGTCNTSTGVCSNPNKANGSACSDGDACTPRAKSHIRTW
jgi:hypothetical protein